MSHEAVLAHMREIAAAKRRHIQVCRSTISDLQTQIRHETNTRDRYERELREIESSIMTLEAQHVVDRGQPADSRGPDGPTGPDIAAT